MILFGYNQEYAFKYYWKLLMRILKYTRVS